MNSKRWSLKPKTGGNCAYYCFLDLDTISGESAELQFEAKAAHP